MQKEQILCPNLLAVNIIKGIKNKYYILGFPHAIMEHPNGTMKVFYKYKERL